MDTKSLSGEIITCRNEVFKDFESGIAVGNPHWLIRLERLSKVTL